MSTDELDGVAAAIAHLTRGLGMKDGREMSSIVALTFGLDDYAEVRLAVRRMINVLPKTPANVALRTALNLELLEPAEAVNLEERRRLVMGFLNVSYRTVVNMERQAETDMAALWEHLVDVRVNERTGVRTVYADAWQDRLDDVQRRGLLWIEDGELVFGPRWIQDV